MEKSLAQKVLDGLGGVGNIAEFENCMTRLRVVVKDSSKVDKKALSSIKGVMKVVGTDLEPQIVVGPGVADDISDELKDMPGLNYSVGSIDGAVMQKKQAPSILGFISKVFAPLIPVFAGTGLLFGVMKLLTLLWNLDPVMFAIFNPSALAADGTGGSVFMAVLSVLASTFFGYLNIAVGIQAAKVMGGNPYLGLVAGGIVSNVGGLNGMPMGFGDLVFASGRGGTLAALAAGALIAVVEKKVKKATPHALRVHVPALVSVVVVGIVTLYILQPVAGIVTTAVADFLIWMLETAGPLGTAAVSGLFLPLVMTGLHHGLTPVHVGLIQEFGYSALYPANSMAGAGQVGAAIALYLKYRQNKGLQEAVVGGLPAGILGIGEPLIFGVTLPLGRAFITACIGAAIGGSVLGFFPGQGAVTINVSGILGALVNTMPLVYLLAYAVSVTAGFAITYVVGAKKENLDSFVVEL